ncbi:molybdopterin binding domain protein [Ancylostoma ceylanicum]|uniref:molybdopterin molybdotransferase n=1 Tax=Ancylostoma ceylanicum TaxID=53326 RepID=A0A0D6MB01_9BILA|nr:molybdopterin binding domain protein [Ancylostoma ceylanicum]
MRLSVVTVSDSSAEGQRKDLSGPAIVELIENSTKLRDAKVVSTVTVPDERALIEAILVEHCGDSDVVITTGGTGFAPRDVTPEDHDELNRALTNINDG